MSEFHTPIRDGSTQFKQIDHGIVEAVCRIYNARGLCDTFERQKDREPDSEIIGPSATMRVRVLGGSSTQDRKNSRRDYLKFPEPIISS